MEDTNAGSRRRPPIILDPPVYVLAFRLMSRTYSFLGVALGLALLLGGADRFAGAPFATARTVPGDQITWGLIALLGGSLGLVGSVTRRVRLLTSGVAVLVVWDLFFSLTFTVAALSGRNSLTGCVTYAFAACWGAILLVSLRGSQNTWAGRHGQ